MPRVYYLPGLMRFEHACWTGTQLKPTDRITQNSRECQAYKRRAVRIQTAKEPCFTTSIRRIIQNPGDLDTKNAAGICISYSSGW